MIRFPFKNRRLTGTAHAFTAQTLDSGSFVIFDNLQNRHLLRNDKLTSGTCQHEGESITALIFYRKLLEM